MNYSNYDRFQGAWLGSMIGATLVDRSLTNAQSEGTGDCSSHWLKIRTKIAQNIILAQKIETQKSLEQLKYFLLDSGDFNSDRLSITLGGDILSILLPLIILEEHNWDRYADLISKCNQNSTDPVEIKEYLVLWTYLINLALHHQFRLKDTNVSMIVKQVLGGVEVKTTSLSSKLQIISQAEQQGLSLQQLTAKICRMNDRPNKSDIATIMDAICLSLFCFASTPNNFMLSVKRSSHLPPNLSRTIAILTATISGAANGIVSIPRNWRNMNRDSPDFSTAQNTLRSLYQIWLGTYNPNYRHLRHDPTLHPVAIPRIIQPRPALKIVSQKS